MSTLLVTRVSPFASGSESAEVTVHSGKAEVVAFSFPCNLKVGDVVPNRLSCGVDGKVRSAYLEDWPPEAKTEASQQRLERSGTFAYKGVGQVVDREEGLVEVQGFVIDFGEVSCDGAVEFKCARLDLD